MTAAEIREALAAEAHGIAFELLQPHEVDLAAARETIVAAVAGVAEGRAFEVGPAVLAADGCSVEVSVLCADPALAALVRSASLR